MDAVYSIGRGLRDAIAANGALAAILVDGSNLRVYHETAPANSLLPYIRYYKIGGGYNNRSPKKPVEVYLTVSAVSSNRSQAQQLRSLMNDLLHMQNMDVPDWYNWDKVVEVGTYEYTPSQLLIQNDAYFEYAADYRFRIMLLG